MSFYTFSVMLYTVTMEVHGCIKILSRKLGLGTYGHTRPRKGYTDLTYAPWMNGHLSLWWPGPQHQVLSDSCCMHQGLRMYPIQSHSLLYKEPSQLPTCPSIHPSGPGFDPSIPHLTFHLLARFCTFTLKPDLIVPPAAAPEASPSCTAQVDLTNIDSAGFEPSWALLQFLWYVFIL